jgi:diguanylate cyclase (GGDEF)-like protein
MYKDITNSKQHELEIGCLLQAAQAVSSNLDLDDVLTRITEKLTSALKADGCTISFWDKEDDAVVTWIEYRNNDLDRMDNPGTKYSLGDYPATRSVLENKQIALVNFSDAKADSAEIALMRSMGTTSLLMLPLVVDEGVSGLMEIEYSLESREFSSLDVQLAQTFTLYAAIAIQNSKLLSETQRQLYEQTVLHKAGVALSSALDLNVVMSQISKQMCTSIGATSAYVCDYYADTGVTSVIGEYISDEAGEMEANSDIGVSYDNVEPEFIERLEKGLHDISHHDAREITENERAHMQKYGAQSILYIPLKVKEQLIGFVEIWETRRKRDFTEKEISLCQAISHQAAIALDNAHLFENAQKEIAERKRIEEKLYFDATHDDLTGLANRSVFQERLGQACKQLPDGLVRSLAVLFLDFDRFKVVNDSLGHSFGDQLLIESTRRIQNCLRPTDLLSRLSGDEFAILLEEISHLEDATRIADRIQEVFTQPFIIKDRRVFISTSIGILFDQALNQRPEDLIRDADIAMYQAKVAGKARYAVFEPDLRSEAMTRLEMESDLRQAIEKQEMAVFYQPIFALHSNRLVGFEALVRWLHPTQGLILPGKFIPLAEETGWIAKIDLWVLNEACNQMVAWGKSYIHDPPLTISVNLSGQTLSRSGLINDIQSVLDCCGLPPTQLNLEITERAIMQQTNPMVNLLSRLQQMGVKIYIDDFGIGYSSLSYLHSFPLDAIKIDRSFISSMQDNDMSSGLVNTIIKLAHTLNMSVVAEGVETNNQRSSLKSMQCEEAQGFHFAKPMEVNKIEEHYLGKLTSKTLVET